MKRSTSHKKYEPQYERYIGQFPIDYEPERFPKFTEAERVAFLTEYASKLHAVKSQHPIEFSLMLNGEKGKATDLRPGNKNAFDDPNQVKVYLHSVTPDDSFSNIEQIIQRRLMSNELDVATKITENGMDCYYFTSGFDNQLCFGKSTNSLVSGFEVYIPSTDPSASDYITGRIQELIYGGLIVRWYTKKENMHRAKEIDTAIWRLLDTWNVAPAQ